MVLIRAENEIMADAKHNLNAKCDIKTKGPVFSLAINAEKNWALLDIKNLETRESLIKLR